MTSLVLTRHGETVWHQENRYAGASDIALTAVGEAQAVQLAAWAESAGLAAIWSSDLSRAQATASVSAERCAVPWSIDERLRELDFGDGEGLTAAEMAERFPEALAAFRADPAGNHLPGGEDPRQASRRFVECLDDICARYPDGRVLVVAHSTAIRLALCALIGVPHGAYRRLFPALRNCGLTELRIRGGEVALLEFNAPLPNQSN